MFQWLRDAVRGHDWGYQIFVMALITFPAVSGQCFVVWPWFFATFDWIPNGELFEWLRVIAWLLIFNLLLGGLYLNYYLACATDPGTVPHDWAPASVTHSSSPPISSGTDASASSQSAPAGRYCHKCDRYKPPRAHHCSQCRRCILKMDHHCPWINNCVGYHNQGHFIRFLVHVDLTVVMLFFTLLLRLLAILGEFTQGYLPLERRVSTAEIILIVVNLFILFVVLMAVGILSLYQYYFVATNTTTIESWEKDRVNTLIRRKKLKPIRYPYDVGMLRNIKQVMGDRWIYWMWPQPMPSTGLQFPVWRDPKDPNAADEDVVWPPEYDVDGERFHHRNPHTMDDDGDEDVSLNDNDSDDDDDDRPLALNFRPHVRRGSEGYEVKALTAADRDRMLQAALEAERSP